MQKRELNISEISTLILFTAIIFGALFRFVPTIMAGFPVNDGGMFYVMIQDLQDNQFIPPFYTTYNHINIPFAYPPLAFYVGAGIGSILNIPTIEILRWLPALFNTIGIPAFYFLAKEILNNKMKGAVAALAFAFTPHLNTWLSAGGGLTRSLGTLFLLLTILYSWKLFAQNEEKSMGGVIIFGSLVVLTHTESTVYAITIPMLIWAIKSRTTKSAIQAVWIALGVILLAGPWYGFIISRHGVEPLLSALQTGSQSIWGIIRLINFDIITEESFLDLLGVMGILGICFLILNKEYVIPCMLLFMYIVQPRSSHTIGNIPLAMATGAFIIDVILPALTKVQNSRRAISILLMFLSPYLLANSVYHAYILSEHAVSANEQDAMQWVKENTSADNSFLLITGEYNPICDTTSEWFPALTERRSLTTIQGREWLNDKDFNEFIGKWIEVQSCKSYSCLQDATQYFGDANYILVSLNTPTDDCKASTFVNKTTVILNLLEDSNVYHQIYTSKDIVIFSVEK